MFLIISYLKFLWKSKNEHGIHSPFIFDLVTKCFYDRKKWEEYSTLKRYRKLLLANKDFIEVTDFGAGSRLFTSNKRQISKIAKTAGISSKRAKLLFRLVRYFKSEAVLEIGTSLGLATSAMSLGYKNAKIVSVEGCSETLSVTKEMFRNSDFKVSDSHIKFLNTEFSTYFKTNTKRTIFDLVYFDGNHSQAATLIYFDLLLPTVTSDSVWIFDDIHWSKDMENAWKIIKDHPQVTITIDTFQWGIVFFRNGQEKEHFVIRI